MRKSSKILFAALFLLSSSSLTTSAFLTPKPVQRNVATTAPPSWFVQYPRGVMVLAADAATTETVNESSSEDEKVMESFPSTFSVPSVYDQIGIKPEQLALGIEAEEVLQYIGTRQDLVNRMTQDIPKLDAAKVEKEVDKFLLDAEMLTSFISYEKAKANDKEGMFGGGSARSSDNDLSFKNPKVVATYAAWIAGGVGFSYVRRNYIQPKYDSGEWQDLHITLPNPMDLFNGGGGAASDAVITSATTTTPHDIVIDAATTTISTMV